MYRRKRKFKSRSRRVFSRGRRRRRGSAGRSRRGAPRIGYRY